MKVLLFDTETTGLIDKKIELHYGNLDKFPHIVQLSYVILDTDNFKHLKMYDRIIKVDNNVLITEETSKIHGITNYISAMEGVNINLALYELLTDIDLIDTIVCHNTEFDLTMLKIEIMRLIMNVRTGENMRDNLRRGIDNITNVKGIYCTMKESIDLCNIERENKRGKYLKYPTLTELHDKLFGVIPKKLHNSLNDVLISLRCFLKLKYDVDILEKNDKLKEIIMPLLL